ncbi:hypothetical protein Areg01_15180 [Actinoplanes regularis]|nr:hypothetical protein Areg01_15180 [Actinoplanes regularis]
MQQQRLAVSGEAGAATLALDQGAAQGRLQPAHVLADRSLAQVQDRRGSLKSAAIRDGNQATQRRNVEITTHAYQLTRN